MSDKIGVINEIGDMGLGFDALNDQDQRAYNEQARKEQQNNQQTADYSRR